MLNLQKVRRYNDNLRYNWVGGKVVFKRNINDLPHYLCNEAIQAMRDFPFAGETNRHDNGSFTIDGQRFIWWIEMADCSFDGNRYRTLFFSTL